MTLHHCCQRPDRGRGCGANPLPRLCPAFFKLKAARGGLTATFVCACSLLPPFFPQHLAASSHSLIAHSLLGADTLLCVTQPGAATQPNLRLACAASCPTLNDASTSILFSHLSTQCFCPAPSCLCTQPTGACRALPLAVPHSQMAGCTASRCTASGPTFLHQLLVATPHQSHCMSVPAFDTS